MQMTTRRISGGSDQPDPVPGLDLLSYPDTDGRQMVVGGLDPVTAQHAVVNHDLDAVAPGPAGLHDRPSSSGSNRSTAWNGEVHSSMQFVDAQHRMHPHAEERGDRALDRHREKRAMGDIDPLDLDSENLLGPAKLRGVGIVA